MSIVLYDLAGADDRRFSPNCWRTRMALAHKGLDCEARATGFLDIPRIRDGTQKTIPVIEHDGKVIAESFAIAEHLADTYPDLPPLFHGPGGRALTFYLNNWVNSVVHPAIARLIMLDVHAGLRPDEKDYFRSSREGRFKMTLEQFQDRSDGSVAAFRALFGPMRLTLARQPFLGGDKPLYADYLVFGAFMWARVASPFPVLTADDPMHDWVERCLDLHGGLARRARSAAA
jgi:glutathione S-transferase